MTNLHKGLALAEQLRRAKKLIEKPERWCKGVSAKGPDESLAARVP